MNDSPLQIHRPRLARWFPVLGWLQNYQMSWLPADLLAGTTLAAYLIPSSIGDASLARLPPAAGLYACILSGMVFWIFTGSRHTSITVTSAISLLVGSSLGPLAGGDPARYAALAAGTAVLVSLLAFFAWLVRAGVIVNFISETVLIGFKTGVALYIASSQLPKLCGIESAHGNFRFQTLHFIKHLNETNFVALSVGLVALIILLLGKKFLPTKPVGIVVLVGSLVLGAKMNLAYHDVQTLGQVPQGLPSLGIPTLQWSDINNLLPLSMACFLLAAVETVAVGRMLALKDGTRLDSGQEFLALAGANLAAGLGHGYPTSGGMSQSVVNEDAGSRTPLSGFIAALMILFVTAFLSGMLRYLPLPVLAAIVIVAVTSLFSIASFKRLWNFSRGEFAVAVTAMLGVLCSGLLMGVLIGTIISVLLLLRSGMHPHTTELGRVPGTEYFADIIRHPTNDRIPHAFIFRCDGPILYYNAEYVRDRFFAMFEERSSDVRLAVFFLGTVPTLDLAGVELLTELQKSLKERGIDFRFAEAHSGVRATLRRAHFEESYGPIEPDQTVSTVLHKWHDPQSN